MPLPSNFFETPSILDDDKKQIRKHVTSNLPSPGDPIQEDAIGSGSAWDLFEEGVKGYASGLGWGATEFLEDDEPLSRWGTAGRIIGETGALFTPYVGPFAAIGKVGRGLTGLGKMSTKSLIKAGARDAGTVAITSTKANAAKETNYILNQARKISRASQGTNTPLSIEQVTSQLSTRIEKGILKSANDPKTYKWMQSLAGTAQQKQKALQQI